MGIFKDIKKAFKGDEDYQKRKKGPISKAAKKVKGAAKGVAKDVKSAVKGSKEYQAGKAKKKVAKAKEKEGKSWKRATQRAKKSGGPSMSTLIKAIILSTLLTNDPIIVAMPPVEKVEARKRGKQNRGRRRGGSGLR